MAVSHPSAATDEPRCENWAVVAKALAILMLMALAVTAALWLVEDRVQCLALVWVIAAATVVCLQNLLVARGPERGRDQRRQVSRRRMPELTRSDNRFVDARAQLGRAQVEK